MWLQLLFVLLAIIVGARVGGIGLGVFGGLGLAVLTFIFGLEPTTPPIDVMLMIVAVIAAAGCMQAAGGLDLMVKWAEKILRRHPQRITLLSPLVTYLFTFFAGTGHVAYSVLPVIAEVARETGIRPERPMGIAVIASQQAITASFTFFAGTGHVAYSVLPVIAEVARETGIRPERPMGIAVIASQQAITASPISAATVALLSMLAGYDITLFDILKISIPCTLVGVLVGALYSMRVGKELKDDPVYQARLKSGELSGANYCTAEVANPGKALTSVLLFLGATVGIVLFGSIDSLRPSFQTSEGVVVMQMAHIIEVLMLSVAALILLLTGTSGMKAAKSSVFNAGMQAVVAIFGIAWMGDTFISGNIAVIKENIFGLVTDMPWLFGSVFNAGMQAVVAIFGIAWMGDTFISGNIAVIKENIFGLVTDMPWLFGIALFVMSILLFSQAATIRALLPLGMALGISPYMLIALFPAVNGYFFIPNYPTVVAAINFDTTGTTRIGKYVLNHSFMMPGLISTIVAVGLGILAVLFV